MFSITVRRAPATLASRAVCVRSYSSSSREGSVAQSKEFGKRERAQEEDYARRHDAELLRKLKLEIEEKNKQLAELESKVKDTKSK